MDRYRLDPAALGLSTGAAGAGARGWVVARGMVASAGVLLGGVLATGPRAIVAWFSLALGGSRREIKISQQYDASACGGLVTTSRLKASESTDALHDDLRLCLGTCI